MNLIIMYTLMSFLTFISIRVIPQLSFIMQKGYINKCSKKQLVIYSVCALAWPLFLLFNLVLVIFHLIDQSIMSIVKLIKNKP